MINNPQIGMKVEVLPSLVQGMSAGKWAALGRARQGRVIYISGNRWVLVEFPGVLGAYREAFFLQDLGEITK